MPHVETEIIIPAPLETVYAIAKKIEEFPEFVPDVKSIIIVERMPNGFVSDWVGTIEKLHREVKWREVDEWDDDAHLCRFHAIEGDWQQYEGVWSFEAVDGGTRMVMHLDCDVNVPMIGALIKTLIKKLTTENIDSIFTGIRRRALGEV